MKISLIQPSRNNLKYLKWSYDAIRKNQEGHEVEICVADDASTDGTWEWCQEMMEKDPHFKAILNDTGKRLGHTILYDRLINEAATHDVAMIYHADMYLCPGALDAIEQEIKPRTIVSLTRIEPPLHPDGPEKILRDFGVEPEEFKEEALLAFINSRVPTQDITEGIFAPWAFYREDFQKIGGHDPLYAPQSKEDSDIFNRFLLDGVNFVQTWHGCVYHMTCRGSRRNTVDKAKNIYEDSPEWLAQNMRSTRNFIRKWGHFVMHDALMKPIVPPKYDIGIIATGGIPILEALEPWCSTIYIKDDYDVIVPDYIAMEQPNTLYDLKEKIKPFDNEKNNEILIEVDQATFDNETFRHLQNISQIIKESGEPGRFKLGNMVIDIIQMNEYQNTLINI
ncbi:glycosyltransferase family 2 protein [bacterium]|nr:glycosyltransferase family 2 protein [bacterium]